MRNSQNLEIENGLRLTVLIVINNFTLKGDNIKDRPRWHNSHSCRYPELHNLYFASTAWPPAYTLKCKELRGVVSEVLEKNDCTEIHLRTYDDESYRIQIKTQTLLAPVVKDDKLYVFSVNYVEGEHVENIDKIKDGRHIDLYARHVEKCKAIKEPVTIEKIQSHSTRRRKTEER